MDDGEPSLYDTMSGGRKQNRLRAAVSPLGADEGEETGGEHLRGTTAS